MIIFVKQHQLKIPLEFSIDVASQKLSLLTLFKARSYQQVFRCILNNSSANVLELVVVGQGAIPDISLEDNGNLFFKPTCIGIPTKRTYTVKNITRVPLNYTVRCSMKLLT